jgi:flagellin
MTVINTNIKALYTQGALKISQRESRIAMQQLSTGKRINSAKDDAAGLAIATRMTQHIQSLNQSVRNAGDAIVFIQTAEGATNDITSMLQRMSELAVQSANATYSPEQRGYLDEEFQQLKQEIVRIAETHEWNGFPILNGKAGTPVGSPTSTTAARAHVAVGGTPIGLVEGDMAIVTASSSSTGDVTYTTTAISASAAASDTVSDITSSTSAKSASAISIAAAINEQTATTGVTATANSAVISGAKTTVGTSSVQTILYINGTSIPTSLSTGQTAVERRQYVMDAINSKTATHGVTAGDAGTGGLTLSTSDGRNLSVWYDDSAVDASDFGLAMNTTTATNPPGVTGMASAAAAAVTDEGGVEASTVYGTVTMNSTTSFTVTPGANAIDTNADYANFTALGFTPGSVKVQNIGRLSFQVGPSSDQIITIDMADYGKDGQITGGLTSDTAQANVGTVASANDVIQKVNVALDAVATSRSTMGAVMNRLQHVVDNLTNVSMNEEASRSQIEDADYASASTELARTQIMQQAATAVLAQANTDMQTVMKLLQ